MSQHEEGAAGTEARPGDGRSVGMRGPEIGVALFMLLLAGLVIADSLRVGIGWADDGPRSGYFPFYIGLILAAASGWTLLAALTRRDGSDGEEFATVGQLRSVAQIGVPIAVYVAVLSVMGLYVASLALIGYFMKRHGRYGWALTAAVSIGVPLVAFLVFERWFLVPLPKGPLEAALGF
jgi:putative tricarboxylic transport membrane protein